MPEILKSDTAYGIYIYIYVLTLTPRTWEDKVLTFKFEVKKKKKNQQSLFVLVSDFVRCGLQNPQQSLFHFQLMCYLVNMR